MIPWVQVPYAWAAEPSLEVHATAMAPLAGPGAAGVGAAAGVRAGRRFVAALPIDVGQRDSEPAFVVAPRAGLSWPVGGDASWEVTLGAGYAADGVRSGAVGSMGAALELGDGPMATRFAVGALSGGAADTTLLLASVGLRWRRDPPEVADRAAVGAPSVPTDPEPVLVRRIEVSPPGARIWVQHPVCEWISAEDADRLAAIVRPGDEVRVEAPGYLPLTTVVTEGDQRWALQEAPPQGSAIVVAAPGDQVFVGSFEVTPRDGVAIVNAPEGPLDLTVVGGGRTSSQSVFVVEGHALWVRFAEPDAAVIRFGNGSSALDLEGLATVEAVATRLGSWSLEVWGSASSRGSADANAVLADARARTVMEALVAAGVPPDRIRLGPARPADAGLTEAEQRAATIVPIPEADP